MELNYYDLYRNCKDAFFVRIEMVQFEKDHGINATARHFKTTKRTVRKWTNRFKLAGNKGLKDQSKAPKHSPNKISAEYEALVIRHFKKRIDNNQRIIVNHIFKKYNIPYSLPTILKVLRRNRLLKYRRKKHERKRDLRAIKQSYKAFEKIQIDVKYLDDIPEFYSAYKTFNLPQFQITARCIKTGALYYDYMYSNNVINSSLFIFRLQYHLKKYGIDPSNISIQTDNGTEFIKPNHSLKDSLFTRVIKQIMQSKHLRIPPGAKTWQSDVETSHRLIEDEFYSDVLINKNMDFFRQAFDYQKSFNLNRNNSYKGGSPLQILKKELPNISNNILILQPIVLDEKRHLLKNINKLIA